MENKLEKSLTLIILANPTMINFSTVPEPLPHLPKIQTPEWDHLNPLALQGQKQEKIFPFIFIGKQSPISPFEQYPSK